MPDNVHARVNLGIVYRKLSQYDDAIDVLEEALRIQPHDPEANYHLGLIHEMTGISRPPDDVIIKPSSGGRTTRHRWSDSQRCKRYGTDLTARTRLNRFRLTNLLPDPKPH